MIDNERFQSSDSPAGVGLCCERLLARIVKYKGGGGVPGPSKAQQDLEKEQLNLVRKQLEELERQKLQPTPEAPKPLAPLPPPSSTNAADVGQAEAEARRRSLRRLTPGRSTIFAGDTGNAGALGGRKTILG